MDVSELLDGLNDKQREAVAAPLSNMLILAGAGSGKTRVLVHRIAWLMQVEHASPYSIFAVTFTNKAAKEMRTRVEETLQSPVGGMWIGTFHGLSHRILRAHHREANLPESFQILDSDDQQRMIRRLLKAMNIDEKKWPAKQLSWYISARKDEGLRPKDIQAYDASEQLMLNVYTAYQEACDRAGLVDFAEILLRCYELLQQQPTLLRHYQQRFRHMLVDEFQDTNSIQYQWLRLLAGGDNNIMIVGDDDQSIYGWRGAKIENIKRFLKDFDADTIRLEQNYRSTGTILKASNALIQNNSERMGKSLWTDGTQGEPISIYAAFNELDEARFTIGKIKSWLQDGNALTDCAILYRNNAQSRVLEEALLQEGLKYRIYGGMRFFERQEIKDALSYLRIISNRNDDAAFERVINTPARGIGDKTLSHIRDCARNESLPLWYAAKAVIEQKHLAGRAATAVTRFIELIEQLDENLVELELAEQAKTTIEHSGLLAMYQAEKGEKGRARVENLEELINACGQFELPIEEEFSSPLQGFLAYTSLESGEGQADEHEDAVQMMTLHSAKGLEFPLVFMVGVEEGMFPSQQSHEESGRLEEERRLCYVGMTRAMQKLYISHAESRRLYGQEKYHSPSRFLRELPEDCTEEIRIKTQVSRPATTNRFSASVSHAAFEDSDFNLGQRVLHAKFGAGTVLNYEGVGAQSRIQVNFDDMGTKWLVTAYAKLQAL
ncbi:DNA helicase II [Pseudoalteromonas luteoviolacea]|uniref:DNA 3'-5' helicase n=1 Tax=Pseudoalteromonas luteoviolacea S4054 TaxID=1129367 RepID=A0A0F6A4J0_9GAMM|nr:DNA helicase II [Pseudoalteromonas luteoviolacea]AOT06571.1 DNA helicase II [Pseudoalteromonas luteoviolacea]AOT11488.1 DNA helicase II [Pseudoalteromonas luteoviolacea]AOT16401.1 DNA helicase II [Pseudoalteromonas luteoviolacea]KKE81107.1 DNA-dependent helicase [Pseudoalteromonas luteoviolacea S4054]KZN62485.1 DNA-dependent helicase [Pseudoalteromonas luteoviolacea S4047-1]